MESEGVKPNEIHKSINILLERLINLSRRSCSNVHNTCLSLKLKLENTSLSDLIENKKCLEAVEVNSIYPLCIQSQNIKIIENCITLYTFLISHSLISTEFINAFPDFLDEWPDNDSFSLKILQLISKIRHVYKIRAFSLRGYLSFCIHLVDSEDINTQIAARSTTLEMCQDLIETLYTITVDAVDENSIRNKNSENVEFVCSLIVFIRDLFRMLINTEPPHWLAHRVTTHRFLLEILNSIFTSKPIIFLKTQDLFQVLKQEIVPGIIKILSWYTCSSNDDNPTSEFYATLTGLSTQSIPDPTKYRTFISFLTIVYNILNNYFSELQNTGINLLVELSELADVDQQPWTRVIIFKILYGLLRDSKYTSFIIHEITRPFLTSTTTFCIKFLSVDMIQKQHTLSKSTKNVQENDFWEEFFDFQVRSIHYLWDDISSLDVQSMHNYLPVICSLFVILSIPRILYDYLYKFEELSDCNIQDISHVISYIYPTISCLIHTCNSLNPPVVDLLLESVTLSILVSKTIKIENSQNIFLKFLCDRCVVLSKTLLEEEYFQILQHSILYSFCDLIRFHSTKMDINYWRMITSTLIECSFNFQWPYCGTLYLLLKSKIGDKHSYETYFVINQFLENFKHDDFDFSFSIFDIDDPFSVEHLQIFENVNRIFVQPHILDHAGVKNVIASFSEIAENLCHYSMEPQEIVSKRLFIIGRTFDLICHHFDKESNNIIEDVLKIYIDYTHYDCEKSRSYATQLFLLILLYCYKRDQNCFSATHCMTSLKYIIHINNIISYPFIINGIKMILETSAEASLCHFSQLLSSCFELLAVKYTIKPMNVTYIEYMGKQFLLVFHHIFERSVIYLDHNLLAQLCILLERYTGIFDNVNNCFVATGYFMTISDHFCDTLRENLEPQEIDTFFESYFGSLYRITTDSRVSLRKSIVQTIGNIVEVRGNILSCVSLQNLLNERMIDSLSYSHTMALESLNATVPIERQEETRVVYHHTRNTPYKQWVETFLLLLDSSEKILIKLAILMINENMNTDLFQHYLQYLERLILKPHIEFNYHCIHSYYIILREIEILGKNNAYSFEEFWIQSYQLLHRIYEHLITDNNEELLVIKHVIAILNQIYMIVIPKALSLTTTYDVDIWSSMVKLLLFKNFPSPDWFVHRFTFKIMEQVYDTEMIESVVLIDHMMLCQFECLKLADNCGIIKHYLYCLFEIIKEITSDPEIYKFSIENIALRQLTDFYSFHLLRFNELGEFYPTFLKMYKDPLIKKRKYILPAFWIECVPSLIKVSMLSLQYMPASMDITPDILQLIDIIDKFFFCSENSIDKDDPDDSIEETFEKDVIKFISDIIIPLFSIKDEKISSELIHLLLAGFVSVSKHQDIHVSKRSIMPREELNDICLQSLLTTSFGSFDVNNNYIPPNSVNFSILTLNKFVNKCLEYFATFNEHYPQKNDLFTHWVARSLKATRSIFIHSNIVLKNREICTKLGSEYSKNLIDQLFKLYDLCISVYPINEYVLRALAHEAMKEFTALIKFTHIN